MKKISRKISRFSVLELALLFSLFFFSGCTDGVASSDPGGSSAAVSSAAPVELTVFAAASLTEALNEIATLYKTKVPNVTLTFNFDSSGNLQTQIENGAEPNLFLSAAQKQMNVLSDGGYLLPDTRKNLLLNKVVMIVPKDSSKGIAAFTDANTSKVGLIALGNSDVPVGQYSEEIFKYLNIWDAVKSKVSLGTNVKEVISQVASGSVDAGVVYATDAATESDVKTVAEAPADSHSPVVYPAALLKSTQNQSVAGAFLDYLSSSDAVAVFESIGFAMAD